MNRIGTTTMGMMMSSMASALLLAAEAGLQGFQLRVDLLGVAQLGDLLVERLGRRPERQCVGAALGEIGMPLEHVEAGEGVVDLGTGIHLPEARALVGAVEPGLDGVLAGPRLPQFALQLGDVGLGGAKRV